MNKLTRINIAVGSCGVAATFFYLVNLTPDKGLPPLGGDDRPPEQLQTREYFMRLGKLAAAVAAVSMAAAPALAAPVNPAASLSVSKSVRASAPAKGTNKFGGTGAVVAVLALLAVIGGVIAASKDGNSKSP